jgi:hydroxymethylglutaryl-CoA synthase
MDRTDFDAGVSALSLYVPRLRVNLPDFCEWTGNSWDKIKSVVGRSFRVCGRHENVYTMAANAVLRLIIKNRIDPQRVGLLAFGTESSTDNSAGAVIVRGMVDRALDQLGMPRLSRSLEVPELKHACLGGVYALKAAVRYAACEGANRQAIVVCGDIAEYERGSSGEQTQGAGAVAMLVERKPKLFSVDLARAGSASDYRGPDFRKPVARHFSERYPARVRRLTDFPVFSGKYSTFAYLDETVHAVDDMLEKLGESPASYLGKVDVLFFHRPYHYMPVQALSFLYVRALLAADERHAELRQLCTEALVAFDDVVREADLHPDLYAPIHAGEEPVDPYPATNAVAAVARRTAPFRELCATKLGLGAEAVRDFGNLYSAALFAWIAAGLDDAASKGRELVGARMAAIGYGSGDAAEAIPLHVVQGWTEAARRIDIEASLAGAIDLTREQYEALHDGDPVTGLSHTPRDEFVVARVGERYEPAFQDLCVEYYDYVR